MTGITKAVLDSFGVVAEQVVESAPDSKSKGGHSVQRASARIMTPHESAS